MARLGDYIKQIRGVSYKPEDLHPYLDENSITLLRANNIQEGKLVLDDVVFVDKARVREEQVLRKGDILVCTSSGSKDLVGKAALVTEDTQITFGAFCKVVRPISGNPNYIGLFFDSPIYRKKISHASAGANINNIRSEHIDELEISMPEEREQTDAVSILSMINCLISLRKKQMQKLDDLVKSRFVEMFGLPGTDVKGWGLLPLGECCELNPNKSSDDRLDSNLEVSFVPMPAVSEKGTIDTSEIKRYSEVKTGFTYFAEKDVLFAKITPCMENGKGAVAVGLHNGIGFGSTEFHILRPLDKKSNPYWIYCLTSFESFRKDATANMTGSAGQRRVPASFLSRFKVALPPIEMQEQFAAFIAQVNKSKLTVQQGLDKLELLKQSLMQKYFG